MKHSTFLKKGVVCTETPSWIASGAKALLLSLMFVLWGGADLIAQSLSASVNGPSEINWPSQPAQGYAQLPDGFDACGPIAEGDWTLVNSASSEFVYGNWNFIFGVNPSGCTNSIWTGGYYGFTPNEAVATVEVEVPASASLLSFEYLSMLMDLSNDGLDFSQVKINGEVVFTKFHTAENNTDGYVDHTIDISAFAGQSITIELSNVVSEDNAQGNVLFGCFEFLCSSCVPQIYLECAANTSVECGQEGNLDLTGMPSIDVAACDDITSLEVSHTDLIIPGTNCSYTIIRTWVATFGDVTESCTQTITVIDTQSPVISGVEPVVTVQCLEEVPAPAEASASDACVGNTPVVNFVSNTGELVSHCDLTTAFGPGADWAIWMPTLYNLGYSATSQFHFVGGGSFDQFNDGTARIYGTIENSLNPNQQFLVDFWFENASDWTTWSSMGRSYKDDLGCAQPNHYMDWTYYEMVNDFSSMTGQGDYAGDVLYFQHMPINHYFGLQIGQGANNKNCNFGLSTWFYFNGFMDGTAVNGIGDVNADASCQPNNEQDCVHNTEFTYLYRSADDCGHASIVSQQIIVEDTTAPEFVDCPEAVTVECSDELPALANPTAVDNCSGDVTVTYLGEQVEAGECLSLVTRTWAADDICGNRTFCQQVISVVDTTAPVFDATPAEEVTFECSAVEAPEVLTATDNCAETASVSYNEEIVAGNCTGNYTIIRTWVAVDNCENERSFTQTVNVVDTTAPVFDEYEYYTHILCEELPSILTAQDNCGSVEVVVSFEELNSGGCLGVLHRIYTATDDCGNSSTAEQFIAIQDFTAPVIYGVGEEMTVECSDVAGEEFFFGIGDIYAIDNCGGDVSLTYDEEIVLTDDNCPQSFDVIRTWTAIDYCENVSTLSQLVHIVDTTAPVFVEYIAEQSISCDAEIPAPFATANDNCGMTEVSSNDVIIEGNCPQAYTIVRTFTAVDECGNASELVTYINIYDEEAPVFAQDATYQLTVECSDEIPYVEPAATDNCGLVSISHVDNILESSACYTSIARVFTATDECGNSNEFTQYISIVDTTAPVFDAYTIEITRPCDDFEGVYVSATDNCNEFEITFIDEVVSGACAGRIIRQYMASDICGNVSYGSQIITLIDEVNPVAVSTPESFTVECGSEYSMSSPEFTDNCDSELEVSENISSEIVDCATIITYTWTAVDHCYNETTVSATVTIVDTTAPEWEYVPADVTIECDQEIPAIEMAYAYDVCDNDVDVEVTEEAFEGDCANSSTLRRLYRAFDDCGNEIMAYQYVYIVDTTAPEMEGVSELTVECSDEIPYLEPATFDNCGEVIVSYNDVILEESTCGSSILRTFTATDACGNSSSFEQNITIVDTTAPVFEAYSSEINLPCDDYAGIYVAANDACNEVEITYNDDFVSGGCQGRIIRTYTANDGCGNASTAIQIITLTDMTAPEASVTPENFTVQCSDETWSYAEVSFTDNCDDEVEVEFTVSYTPEGCLGFYTATWTALDNCGNETVVTQVITVIDTIAPSFEYVPSSYTIECSEELELANAFAFDDCSDAEVSVSEETTEGNCPNTYTLVRTFTAVDNCGNTAVATQTINVVDTTAPLWNFESAPYELSFECDEVVAAVEPTAFDNCNNVEIMMNETIYYESPCYTSGAYIFTAVDACGNESVPFYQTFVIVDTTAPVFNAFEAEISLPCDDYSGVYVSATDNCNEVEISYTDEFVSGGCQGRIIRTYVALDACENGASVQQIITLTDATAPVIAVEPMDMIIECGEEVPGFEPSFSDNCDDELELTAISGIAFDGCDQIISRSWSATDNCGNTTTVSQEIRIVDTTAPYFVSPPVDFEISCTEEIVFEGAQAADVCDDSVEVTVSEVELPGNCAGSYTIERTFTATDDCGNSTVYVQVINVFDATAPEFTFVPENSVVACADFDGIGTATAIDSCSDAVVDFSEIVEEQFYNEELELCGTLITRNWTAVDACGNAAAATTVVFVYDNVAPTFDSTVSNVNVSCASEIPAFAVLTASDACSSATVTRSEEILSSDDCGNQVIEVSYVAVDACGNEANFSYTITVEDTEAPVLSSMPSNIVLACEDAIPAAEVVTATDNCGAEIEVSMIETIIGDQPAEGSIADCNILTPALPAGNPCNYPTPWAMALFNMPSSSRYYTVLEGNFVQYPDGSAHATAVLVSTTNSNAGFNVDVWFNNQMDWSEFSTQGFPTSFKADCGGIAANHEEWMYFLLVNGEGAELVGWGDFAGSALNLSHAPANNYFGFQLGDGANNYSGVDNGFGGWFTYNGTFMNLNSQSIQTVNGAGDFAFELDCCPDYEIVRCYTAMDCSGNVTEYCQTISFNNEVAPSTPVQAPSFEAAAARESHVVVYPNPAVDQTNFVFEAIETGKAVIEIYNLTGAMVASVYTTSVEAGNEYKTTFDAGSLATGVYMYKLTNGNSVEMGRLIIKK